jgi:hypothetical protein
MGGVAVQQLFILIFFFYAIKFHRTVLRQILQGMEDASSALPLLYGIYAVLLLITVRWLVFPQAQILTSSKIRIIFRLIEYSHGFKSNIPNHEAYQYGLDSVPMLLALVLLNFLHPGRIMPGKDSDLPSRKQRKVKGIRNKGEKINGGSTFTA